MVNESIRPHRSFRPAHAVSLIGLREDHKLLSSEAGHKRPIRVLFVDLNNFASFPTLAVGLLVAALRGAGMEVQVICPLAHDKPANQRERRESWVDHAKRRVHLSTSPAFRELRDAARRLRTWSVERPNHVALRELKRALEDQPDAVLLSAYLQHFDAVRAIAALAQAKGVPVLLGGPMFNLDAVAGAWRSIPGVSAVAGGESDHAVVAMVQALVAGRSLDDLPGVMGPEGLRRVPAQPLRPLDATPMADFTDFPWDRYPVRIVPIMTGRGCQWDRCAFCSDVVSASGRSFRTRSVQSVLLEMQEQARRHDTTNFLFLDLKLNSNPHMLRGIASGAQGVVRGAEWIGTVHVDRRADNGLSRRDLEAAVAGGMRRVSFGLETGSQRLLDLMSKGSSVDTNSQFIRDAHAAGLSVRCTMFKGFPGETAQDMELTADFLEAHSEFLDRIRFNDFSLMEGTPIHSAMVSRVEDGGTKAWALRSDAQRALLRYRNSEGADRAYRRAKARVLRAVFEVNRRPVRATARQFDGLM